MTYRKALLICAAAALSCFSPGPASSTVPLDLVGHYGGETNGVAVTGSLAIAGAGTGVVTVDVSNPSSPAALGRSRPLGGLVTSLAAKPGWAFAGASSGGVVVLHVSDPTHPTVAARYPAGNVVQVVLTGSYLYAVVGSGGVVVLDVSSPASPSLVTTINPGGTTRGCCVDGSRLFLARDTAGLTIYDVSNLASPQKKGTVATAGAAYCVAASGRYAYAGYYHGGLQVVDVLDIDNPSIVGTCVMNASIGWPNGVEVIGSTAFVADVNLGLVPVNVSTPASPVMLTAIKGGAYGSKTRNICITGTSAWVALGAGGLDIVDVSVPAALVRNGNLPTLAGYSLTIAGNTAYSCDKNGAGITTLDITNRSTPVGLGGVKTSASTMRYAVLSGNLLFAVENKLAIIDVSNRAAPSVVSRFSSTTSPAGVAVKGNYAFYSDYYKGLISVDVSNPGAPFEAGRLTLPQGCSVLRISGDTAFVAAGAAGVHVVDISNPAAPALRTTLDTDNALGIDVQGSYLFVADVSYLRIVDVSDPAHPVLKASVAVSAQAVDVEGRYAYVVGGGLTVLDVADPLAPVAAGSYPAVSSATNVAAYGDYIYVTDNQAGILVILRGEDGAPTIGGSKKRPSGGLVSGMTGVVTYRGFNHYYLQSVDRSSGIRVLGASMPSQDDLLSVSGSIQVDVNGEKYIQANGSQTYLGTATVRPLVTRVSDVGGGPFFHDPEAGSGQAGVTGVPVGWNNVGLMLRVCGLVIESGTTWYVLDDGSGRPLKVLTSTTMPSWPVGYYVRADGVCSLRREEDTLRPVLLEMR